MARIANTATQTLAGLLRSSDGLAPAVAGVSRRENIELAPIGESSILTGNPGGELAGRSRVARYPALSVYCDKVSNLQREKFRSFSGTARMNIEVRVSGDRYEHLERELQLYVDAVTDVLENSRGDWGQGISYSGGYEIQFAAVKPGGRNFTQTAKVTLEVDVSQPPALG